MIVYGLSSSKDGIIRYIGQTRNSSQVRLKAHVQESFRKDYPKTYKCFWIRKVVEEGYQVVITTLVGNAIHNIDEKILIAAYKALGFDLVNATDGGDNSFDLSPEARKKMSERRKGKKLSAEVKFKLSMAKKGRKLSEETKKKISQTLSGHGHSEETKSKIKRSLIGKKLSTETRAKLKVSQKEAWKKRKSTLINARLS